MIEINAAGRRAWVVGIAGGSASGKSTLARALRQALQSATPPLRAAILSSDYYFLNGDPDAPSVRLPGGESHFDYNRPDSIDVARLCADLDRLAQGDERPDVLLLEGLMVLHEPAIRQRLDLGVYIELAADERALRRLVRNLGADGPVDFAKGQWIADYYCASARPGHQRYVQPSRAQADLIVRGDADPQRTASLLAAVVRDGLARLELATQPGEVRS